MNNYFLVKVKYEKINERGAAKKVTEPYLVDALSWAEAEARAIENLEPYLSGEFVIHDISRANFTDIFPFEDSDRWFKCKVAYVTIDEERGTEKRKSSYILVQANDCDSAYHNLQEAMKDTISDYEVEAVTETKIMDVFPYIDSLETTDDISTMTDSVEALFASGEEISIELLSKHLKIDREKSHDILIDMISKGVVVAKNHQYYLS